jgi:hypothetical protein
MLKKQNQDKREERTHNNSNTNLILFNLLSFTRSLSVLDMIHTSNPVAYTTHSPNY